MTLDRSNPLQATVQLLVGHNLGGEAVMEEVPVESIRDGRYRILASPGVLDGLAAGDVFERFGDGSFAVVERSRNLAVQVWYPGLDLDARVDDQLLPGAEALGGWLDGRSPGVTVLTFPFEAGWSPIETLLNGWVASSPGAGWSYANVYGPDGETPLRWWEDDRASREAE